MRKQTFRLILVNAIQRSRTETSFQIKPTRLLLRRRKPVVHGNERERPVGRSQYKKDEFGTVRQIDKHAVAVTHACILQPARHAGGYQARLPKRVTLHSSGLIDKREAHPTRAHAHYAFKHADHAHPCYLAHACNCSRS